MKAAVDLWNYLPWTKLNPPASTSTRPWMQTKDRLVEQLDWLTDKISSQVWTLNLGTLATTWSLLIAAGNNEKLRIGSGNAIPIMALCIIAMLFELGQYLAGYFNTKSISLHLARGIDVHSQRRIYLAGPLGFSVAGRLFHGALAKKLSKRYKVIDPFKLTKKSKI